MTDWSCLAGVARNVVNNAVALKRHMDVLAKKNLGTWLWTRGLLTEQLQSLRTFDRKKWIAQVRTLVVGQGARTKKVCSLFDTSFIGQTLQLIMPSYGVRLHDSIQVCHGRKRHLRGMRI
jgi:hypothetical protein